MISFISDIRRAPERKKKEDLSGAVLVRGKII